VARRPFIAGNWKMYQGNPDGAASLAKAVIQSCGSQEQQVRVAVCPPATALAAVCGVCKGTGIGVGGQNLYPKDEGAFTGEISGPFLSSLGCTHVILGHSERRTYFGEEDQFINEKVIASLASNLVPIFCCGESQAQREEGSTEQVVETQIRGGLANLSALEIEVTVIAYEPIWAIGTGKTATPEDAQSVHAFIRTVLSDMTDESTSAKVCIQYGGSVKPESAETLLAQPDIDGALVGGASLDAESFAAIVRAGL